MGISTKRLIFIGFACQSNEIEATFLKRYSDYAYQETVNLYKGDPSSGNLIMTIQGYFYNDWKQYAYPFCLKRDQSYYIEYYDSGNNGWSSGSCVQIIISNTILFDGSLGSGSGGHDIFVYPSCQSDELEITLIRQYGPHPAEESFSLYKGTSSSGILVTSKQGASYNNGIRYQYTICMERDQSYYIEYHDSGCNGWDSGSSVQLLNGQNVVFEGRLESGESGSDLLTTASIILSTPQTQWKYTDFPQFNTEWTKSSFNDSSWSTASSGDYSVRAITTRYYRFSGTMENRDSITTLYSIINNRYGFVLYIQGIEVYRYHMPSGPVTPTTPATESNETCYVRVSANKFLLPQSGPFVLAYEVHLPEGVSNVADPFACYAYLGTTDNEGDDGRSRFISGHSTAIPDGDVDALFDSNPNTYYETTESSSPVITYQFNEGRAKWFNDYSLTRSSSRAYPKS